MGNSTGQDGSDSPDIDERRSPRRLGADTPSDFTASILFVVLKDLKSCTDAPQIPAALEALHAYCKPIDAHILCTLTGALIVLRDTAARTIPEEVARYLAAFKTPFPLRIGVAYGHLDVLEDADGKLNIIGPEINVAARIAFAKANPGCLIHESFAHSVDGTLASEHWLHSSRRRPIAVPGKEHDCPFVCFEAPFQYNQDSTDAANSSFTWSPSTMIAYDLPGFSAGDRAQLRKRFEGCTKLFRRLLRQYPGTSYLSPGGDGGVLVMPELRLTEGARFCQELSELSAIENRDLAQPINLTMRIGVHYGRITTFMSADGQMRPIGRDLFVADAVAGDAIARRRPGVIITKQIAKALAGGSDEHFRDRFDVLDAGEAGTLLDDVDRYVYRSHP
jgi:class 3 adenylate cyclase